MLTNHRTVQLHTEADPFNTDVEVFIICKSDIPTDRGFKGKAVYFKQTERKTAVTRMLGMTVNYIPV